MSHLGRVVVGLVHVGDGPVRGGGGRVVVLAVLVLQPGVMYSISAANRPIGFTIGFHNHGEGTY